MLRILSSNILLSGRAYSAETTAGREKRTSIKPVFVIDLTLAVKGLYLILKLFSTTAVLFQSGSKVMLPS